MTLLREVLALVLLALAGVLVVNDDVGVLQRLCLGKHLRTVLVCVLALNGVSGARLSVDDTSGGIVLLAAGGLSRGRQALLLVVRLRHVVGVADQTKAASRPSRLLRVLLQSLASVIDGDEMGGLLSCCNVLLGAHLANLLLEDILHHGLPLRGSLGALTA